MQSPTLLVVSDGKDQGKLYHIHTGKEGKDPYDLSWFRNGHLPKEPDQTPTIFCFTGDRALIYNKDGYGYIDESGNRVIKPQYDWAFDFSGDAALVCTTVDKGTYSEHLKMMYINKRGKNLFSKEFDFIHTDLNHEESFFVGNCVKLIERRGQQYRYGLGGPANGEIILPIEYTQMRTIQNGQLLLLEKDKSFGIADTNGKILVPTDCQDILFRSATYYNWKEDDTSVFPLLVSNHGKWRYVKQDGTFLPIEGQQVREE